jgi:transcriptional regulator with GAF, ATPase, and Fis domain
LENKSLRVENKKLKRKVAQKYTIVGSSKPIEEVMRMITKVAATEARVLITGENGTGKELVAHQLHQQSDRSKESFIEVNCAAIPSELIESELFGHVKGAFTSAVKDRSGKFEAANNGTLFLDEIADMSLAAQAKVLRALQERKIQRVGNEKDISVDVRVIAATNKDLKKEISEGRFREDLYHRLAVIMIHVPSLGQRKEDIPVLTEHFVELLSKEQGLEKKEFSPKALEKLDNYPWTGNVRELRNVVERLMILGENPITAENIDQFAPK